jgi:hypothetical protein
MPTKFKRQIDDSKRRRDFKFRSKERFDRKNKQKVQEETTFIQRKRHQPKAPAEEDKRAPREGEEEEDDPVDSGEEMDEFIQEEDAELEKDIRNDEADYYEEFDNQEFLKNAAELDLPESDHEG